MSTPIAGWTAENQSGMNIFGWRTEEAAEARLSDEREVSRIYPFEGANAVLTSSAISLSEAWKRGILYVNDVTKPEVLRTAFGWKRIPEESKNGFIIPHFTLSGRRSMQFRPQTPYTLEGAKTGEKPRKYDWSAGGGSGISVGYNAALRLADGTARRLAIVEGTKQAIAADIYAADDVAVVGIAGIWNGQFTNDDGEHELLSDLATLARRFSDITVIPDGDVATKMHVWDGASLLCALLYGAMTADVAPRVVTLPTAEGIDDLLGRTEENERGALLATLLDSADALPERPYNADTDAARPVREESRWDRLNAGLGASTFVEVVYGGFIIDNTIELSEGTLTIGRFDRGNGPEFVKTSDPAVASLLGIEVEKCATSASLLISAIGGKAAWAVLGKFDGMPSALIEWLDDNYDRLKAAATELISKKPKPDALRSILIATGGDIDKTLALIKEAQAKETDQ